jgi:hypothetical protein
VQAIGEGTPQATKADMGVPVAATAKIWSHRGRASSAISTFLAKPTMKMVMPRLTFCSVKRPRSLSCIAASSLVVD